MSIKALFINFRDKYMRSQVERMNFPEFPPDDIKRFQIIFSGTVQGVGFRYETWLIAEKLGLTGFCENLPNGDVREEIQGQENKIQYLIRALESIPRIYIEKKVITELPLKEEEKFELRGSRP